MEQIVESVRNRQITLADGRYMIFYTFEESGLSAFKGDVDRAASTTVNSDAEASTTGENDKDV